MPPAPAARNIPKRGPASCGYYEPQRRRAATYRRIYGLAGLRVGCGMEPREAYLPQQRRCGRRVRHHGNSGAREAALASLDGAEELARRRAVDAEGRGPARGDPARARPRGGTGRHRGTSSTSRSARTRRRSSRRCCAKASSSARATASARRGDPRHRGHARRIAFFSDALGRVLQRALDRQRETYRRRSAPAGSSTRDPVRCCQAAIVDCRTLTGSATVEALPGRTRRPFALLGASTDLSVSSFFAESRFHMGPGSRSSR